MGELLLCNESIAAMPYYVEGISVNLYSIEELCYYILNNTYLLEPDFMSDELCTWIDKEVNRPELADKLRDIMRSAGKLADFISLILNDCGYCTKQEIRNVCESISELEEKSEFECNKIRADRLMERDKILSAIYEYKHLITSKDSLMESPELVGNIWHNLGTAYARLFLFDSAIACYHQAYALSGSRESMKAELLSIRCKRDEEGFIRAGILYGLNENELQEIRNELTIASRNEETEEFEARLEQIARNSVGNAKAAKNQEILSIIAKWKEDYRHISRI